MLSRRTNTARWARNPTRNHMARNHICADCGSHNVVQTITPAATARPRKGEIRLHTEHELAGWQPIQRFKNMKEAYDALQRFRLSPGASRYAICQNTPSHEPEPPASALVLTVHHSVRARALQAA